LQISGHTHGGQFFPWNLAAALDQPFIAGLHKFQKMWIYVSKGTGYWGPPLRLGARSEITVITLRREFSQA
jgi:predicted MPP superfamily phosphohydrolase